MIPMRQAPSKGRFRLRRLVCTLPAFRFAFGELRNSAPVGRFITAFHSLRSLHPYQFMNLNGKAEAGVLFDEGDRLVEIVFPAAFDRLNKRCDSVSVK